MESLFFAGVIFVLIFHLCSTEAFSHYRARCSCLECPKLNCTSLYNFTFEHFDVLSEQSCQEMSNWTSLIYYDEMGCEAVEIDRGDGEFRGTLTCDSTCEQTNCTVAKQGSCRDLLAGKCFHRSSVITYKGQHFNVDEFRLLLPDGGSYGGSTNKTTASVGGVSAERQKLASECVIPHVTAGPGRAIGVTCGLANAGHARRSNIRVTDEHLIAVKRPRDNRYRWPSLFQGSYSFVPARAVAPGDVVFGDLAHSDASACVVDSNSIDEAGEGGADNVFFGLNCLSSDILVNGVHASTFGGFHLLPALYMQVAGALVGAEAASRFALQHIVPLHDRLFRAL